MVTLDQPTQGDEPAQGPESRGSNRLRLSWCQAGISWLLVLLLLMFDPFQVTSGSSRVSEDIVNRILSFLYPSAARDKILVVTMTDDDAEQLNPGRGYPVPLDRHGDVVAALLCSGAAAVFIDINFRSERAEGEADRLARLLRSRPSSGECRELTIPQARRHAVPVLSAFVKSETSPCQPLAEAGSTACEARSKLESLRASVHPVSMPGTGDLRRYILSDDALSRYIPASSSPALELLLSVCERRPSYAPGCRDLASLRTIKATGPRASTERPAAALRWGLYAAAANTAGEPASTKQAQACPAKQREPQAWLSSLTNGLGQFFRELLPVGATSTPRLGTEGWCPYHRTLTAYEIIDLASRDGERDRLRALVADRIVIYGADITAVNDNVVSPVLGRLPGAHVHAMMVDNLLTHGASYWRDPKPLGLTWFPHLDWGNVLEFVVAGLAIFVGLSLAQCQRSIAAGTCTCRLGIRGIGASYLVGGGLAILAIVLVCHFAFNWAPINWVGLFAVLSIQGPTLLCLQDLYN